ncbi:MAG: ergothioneine biosynthesis protein EgtB [Solirubrobacteraceae bacterium]
MDRRGVAAVARAPGAGPADALGQARERTLALVQPFSDEVLEQVHSKLMSPLVWDLGHIAAFEDLWIAHRLAGMPLLREDLADVYDAFETPRAGRGEIPFLRAPQAREYLRDVRERTLDAIASGRAGNQAILKMIVRHEQQHNETMLQTIELARLEGLALDRAQSLAPAGGVHTGLELIEIPAGPCTVGARDDEFAYDNERPLHRVQLPAFKIGRTPVTNGAYLEFVRAGGYLRREWWSPEGWRWRLRTSTTRPQGWSEDLGSEWRLAGARPLDPHRPVVHVSWYEADAFARAHGARLPSEAEWEKAAGWDEQAARARARPWGDAPARPGVHANVDQLGGGTAVAGALPAGESAYGLLGAIGDVWEWTSSQFDGYPGFRPFPYREYSEVFFGQGMRVLRGGSWATSARVASTSFRNWDLPQRRQIFAGIRLARDV